MKKIKVCHVVSGLKSGGVESMIYNYCSRFNKNKYEFHLLYQHDPCKKNVEEFNSIGFKLKRITSKAKNPIKNYKETLKYLKDNSIDVVHCHMTLMNFIPLIAAKKAKISKRICHSHNSNLNTPNLFIKFIYFILKKICIKYSTSLIACGIDAGKYMYGNKNFIIIYNALNTEKFKYNHINRVKIRDKYNIKKDEILIGHIGRFTNQKNHKFIIEMFNNLVLDDKKKKYKLVLIGDGELKTEIEYMVEKFNLKGNVIFTGVIDNTNEFYSAMDLFILPSLWEGFPVVGVEAQISGTFCLFSSTIDNDCKVNDNVRFLKLDKKVWINCIKNCKFNKVKYNKKIIEEKHLNIETEYKILETLYSKN